MNLTITTPKSQICRLLKTSAAFCTAVLLLSVDGSAAKPAPVAYAYNLRQISIPPGTIRADARDLNNSGVVAGQADFSNNEWTAFLLHLNGSTTLLPTLENAQIRRASASSIADNGLVSGASITYLATGPVIPFRDNFRATFWENHLGTFVARDWNHLLPGSSLQLTDGFLSSDGQFVVFRAVHKIDQIPFTLIAQIVYQDGLVQSLNPLAELSETRVHSVSHDGQGLVRVLGSTTGATRQYFLWRNDLPGIHLASYSESPEALMGDVNNYGDLVTTRSISGYNSAALLWNESDLWNLNDALQIGTFGGSISYAASLNDDAHVVGRATAGGRVQEDRAFLFRDGLLQDLNKLAPVGKLTLRVATRINNAGHIIATAQSGSSYVTVLLIPLP